MKFEIKNLHNFTFNIDCDENETVKVLKEKIAGRDDLPEKYDPELLKLLCTGKVMDDEDMIKIYTENMKPNGFLVLVKQTPGKPKPPPKKKPNQGFNNQMGGFGGFGGFGSNSMMHQPFQHNSLIQPFPHSSSMQQPFQHGAYGQQSFQPGGFGQQSFQSGGFGHQSPSSFKPSSQPSATGLGSGLSDTSAEAFSTPEDRKEALEQLLGMGFERSQAEKALRASFYNVEAATEFLLSGNIPTVDEPPVVPQGIGSQKPAGASIVQENQSSSSANRRGGMGANIQQMHQMLQQNPEQLQVLKETLKTEHPQIAQMIDENPQAFLELLSQAGGTVGGDNDQPATGPSASGITGGGGVGGQGQNSITVNLSAKEQEIINRLQDMGFDRNQAIEAFLACDRNEELAINYLLNFN